MKPFIRIKEIHGHKYAYEITPYYDPKTKQIRQKSRYLGKYEDGKIQRVRYSMPRRAFDYGELVPVLKVLDDMEVGEILHDILPDRIAKSVITLAINRLISPLAMDNIRVWYERTFLSQLYGDLPLSSQSLSRILSELGDSDVGMEFSHRLMNDLQPGSALMYDITSISSYSKLMDILEYGYNRDGDDLPQLNLSVVAHRELGIPVFYEIYPGSIVDVSTLHNTIHKIKALGMESVMLILDRGFFSSPNLLDLKESGYNFVIPGTFSSKNIKSLVLRMRRAIEAGKYLSKFNGEIIFVKRVEVEVEGERFNAYVIFSPERENKEKIQFYGRLHDVMERLERRKLRGRNVLGQVFKEVAGPYAKYLRWKFVNGKFQVTVRSKAISQRINRMGFVVLIYSGEYDWKDVLTWYRERDLIEKMFRAMKNDINSVPFRAHKTEVAKGLVFVNFIALILYFRLLQLMKETDLIKDYSIRKLLLELSKIRVNLLMDGSFVITEISRKQKSILEKLRLDLEHYVPK